MTVSPSPQTGAAEEASVSPKEATNPYLFIVGCPRSGTTLLRRMVDANPLIAIPGRETHWMPTCFRKRIGITADGMVTEELITWLMDYERFQFMNISQAQLEALLAAPEPLPYAAFVSRIFDIFAAQEGKALAGDKTPGYARQIPLLHALWPAARYIHLIRDGRDVCLSFLDWAKSPRVVGRRLPWTEDPVASGALFWEWHVRLGRQAGSGLEPNLYQEVRYEAMVSEPGRECAKISAFLGLPYSDRMTLADAPPAKPRPGLDAKHARLPPTPGIRDWRSEMRPEQVQRFEAFAGDLLEELGYPLTHPAPSPAERQEIRGLRKAYASVLPDWEETLAGA
jgi:hypothetical protein